MADLLETGRSVALNQVPDAPVCWQNMAQQGWTWKRAERKDTILTLATTMIRLKFGSFLDSFLNS